MFSQPVYCWLVKKICLIQKTIYTVSSPVGSETGKPPHYYQSILIKLQLLSVFEDTGKRTRHTFLCCPLLSSACGISVTSDNMIQATQSPKCEFVPFHRVLGHIPIPMCFIQGLFPIPLTLCYIRGHGISIDCPGILVHEKYTPKNTIIIICSSHTTFNITI